MENKTETTGHLVWSEPLLPGLSTARKKYKEFLDRCRTDATTFRLTPCAEPTAYARCFGIFGLNLLQDRETLEAERQALGRALADSIRAMRQRAVGELGGKPYRQLLAFTLSALAALGMLAEDPLAELVREQLPANIGDAMKQHGVLEGRPQSGNQAMFLAIFLLHARMYLQRSSAGELQTWIDLHLSHMNRNGFWGHGAGVRHLAFQNGYHQYEIFEYLGVDNPRSRESAELVRSLADRGGHFAPYPGGGGCYDYDAVFVLTATGVMPTIEIRSLLLQTASTLLSEQRPDGGFAESLYVRPRSGGNLIRFIGHVTSAAGRPSLFLERARYAAALQRRRHNRIHTHWSNYSRRWDESNLWDSWFRMMTLARIEVALDPSAVDRWGFINYPGIGFHRLVPRDSPA